MCIGIQLELESLFSTKLIQLLSKTNLGQVKHSYYYHTMEPNVLSGPSAACSA